MSRLKLDPILYLSVDNPPGSRIGSNVEVGNDRKELITLFKSHYLRCQGRRVSPLMS